MQVINVGCGMRPTDGAINVDHSYSIALGHHPAVLKLARLLHLLSGEQLQFATFCRDHSIQRMSCSKLNVSDHSMDVVYSSHMLEHLTRSLVAEFLNEAKRVLRPGGTLRIVVPDMHMLVEAYLKSEDCDAFIEGTLLAYDWGGTFQKHVRALFMGFRGHRWMYDAKSLRKLLMAHGFVDVQLLSAGETTICGETQIDLSERADESLYMECKTAE